MDKLKDELKDVTLDDLKVKFGYEESNDKMLNALSDAVLQKLLEIQQHKEVKNRLLMLETLPELFILVDARSKIKKYKRKMILKFKALKMLYRRRHDKVYFSKLEKKIMKRVKRYIKSGKVEDIEGLSE